MNNKTKQLKKENVPSEEQLAFYPVTTKNSPVYVFGIVVEYVEGNYDIRCVYCNETVTDKLGFTCKEIENEGERFFKRIITINDFQCLQQLMYSACKEEETTDWASVMYQCQLGDGEFDMCFGYYKIVEHAKNSRLWKVQLELMPVTNEFSMNPLMPLFVMKFSAPNNLKTMVRLSQKKIEILRLLSEGDTSIMIAAKLKIADSTVNFHKQEIFKKTGTLNVPQLVSWAIRNGVI